MEAIFKDSEGFRRVRNNVQEMEELKRIVSVLGVGVSSGLDIQRINTNTVLDFVKQSRKSSGNVVHVFAAFGRFFKVTTEVSKIEDATKLEIIEFSEINEDEANEWANAYNPAGLVTTPSSE